MPDQRKQTRRRPRCDHCGRRESVATPLVQYDGRLLCTEAWRDERVKDGRP